MSQAHYILIKYLRRFHSRSCRNCSSEIYHSWLQLRDHPLYLLFLVNPIWVVKALLHLVINLNWYCFIYPWNRVVMVLMSAFTFPLQYQRIVLEKIFSHHKLQKQSFSDPPQEALQGWCLTAQSPRILNSHTRFVFN